MKKGVPLVIIELYFI